MRVLTWNILHPDTDDERNADPDRLNKIFDRVKHYYPDIVCLQEVDMSQIEDVYTASFSDYHVVWQNDKRRVKVLEKWRKDREKKPHTMVCATLVRKDMEVLGHTVASRSLTVTVKKGDRVINSTNVHLESGKDVNEIHLKHLTKLVGNADILCGDFNDFIGEPAIEYVKDNGYLSAYAKSRPEYTFYDLGRKMLIDFVFYKPVLKFGHVQWEKETVLSDHVPVIVDFI